MIKVDVDFAKWAKQWDSAETQILKVSKQTLVAVSTSLYTKIISYTPVGDPSLWHYPAPHDYRPGSLKKAWKLQLNENESTISNDLPYAQRVENGWSTQSPNGMMRLGIADFPQLLEQAARRYKF